MWIIADLADVLSRQNVFLLGLVLVIAVLMLRAHRRLGRRQQTKVERPSRRVARRSKVEPHVLDAPSQMRQWEVEMYELARDLSAQLESKISALQALILSADERIQRLDSLVSHDDGASGNDAVPETVDDSTLAEEHEAKPKSPCSSAGAVDGHDDDTESNSTAAIRLPRTQADALSAARATAPGVSSVLPSAPSPRRAQQEIYALDDEGLSAATISARVGSPIGEVELVLSLRSKPS